MANNKTPGSDGFPADFYKFFWPQLKYFVLRSINSGFQIGSLSSTMKQCIISCLPKGEKPRQYLKNWRPISLLNVTYKLASASLALRLKTVLPKIISPTQAGFLPNRFIGECTRLVYDLMEICEHKQIDGLIMLIDFEKAFDSVSWKFLNQTLEFFNFGPDLISKINTLNYNIVASIQQCGHLSEYFKIERGCRQGDPIATYEFILLAQTLYQMIHNNKNVKGIRVGGFEYKISQFADDTTIFLDGTKSSLQAALNILEVFGNYSGLRINTDKTKIIWIGKKRYSKIKYETVPNLVWGATSFDLLGIAFSVDLNSMIKLNYEKYLCQARDIVKHWNRRYLTPIGKITVIKTFIITKFIHIFTTLPNPPEEIKKSINDIIFKFLWDQKPDKIKRTQVARSYYQGGLKMINLENFILGLKITWIRRLLTQSYSPWITLFETTITTVTKIIQLGQLYTLELVSKIHNIFWRDILMAYGSLLSSINPKSNYEKLISPLWYNSAISKNVLYYREWYLKGISIVSDILNEDKTIMSSVDIQLKYRIGSINFLDYHRIKVLVNKFLSPKESLNTSVIFFPHVPLQALILLKDKKGIKSIYNKLMQPMTQNFSNLKWNRDLNVLIDSNTWIESFRITFNSVSDNYLKWLQYKILNRIIGCRYLLKKMKIVDSDTCTFCKTSPQTIIHLFCDCPIIKTLWTDLSGWISSRSTFNVDFSPVVIVLGYLNKNNIQQVINIIILLTKSYIFWCFQQLKSPNILDLQKRIKDTYNTEKTLAVLHDKSDTFESHWLPFADLFLNIE